MTIFSRIGTVIQLYYMTGIHDVEGLLNYRRYVIPNTTMLNTEFWKSSFPDNLAVMYLCSLQDNAVKDDAEYLELLKENDLDDEFEG